MITPVKNTGTSLAKASPKPELNLLAISIDFGKYDVMRFITKVLEK